MYKSPKQTREDIHTFLWKKKQIIQLNQTHHIHFPGQFHPTKSNSHKIKKEKKFPKIKPRIRESTTTAYHSSLGFGRLSRSDPYKSTAADQMEHRSSAPEEPWKPQPSIQGRSGLRIWSRWSIECWQWLLHHPRLSPSNRPRHPYRSIHQHTKP